MMEKYDGVLKELAALLVPHLMAHPDMQASLIGAVQLVNREQVEDLVKSKMDELGPIDKLLVREVCEEVIDQYDIDDKINEYMTNSFDISDWQTEIRDIVDVDRVEEHLKDRLPDAVADMRSRVCRSPWKCRPGRLSGLRP
jgi:hypothetical protein